MAIDTVIINHNPPAVHALQSLRFRDFASFVAWVGSHWHDSQALQHAQWLISPFVTKAQRGQAGADAWRTACWLLPEGYGGPGSTGMEPLALRWLNADAASRLLQATPPEAELQLYGLTELDAPTAQVLAGHKGGLNLSGLRELTPEASTALSSHLGLIRLDGLEAVGGSLAPLALRRGPRGTAQPGLSLGGLNRLNQLSATLLADVQGDLHLNGLRDVDAQQAQWLGLRRGDSDKPLGTLFLDGWDKPSVEALQALAAYEGPLSLGGWRPQVKGEEALWSCLQQSQREAITLGGVTALDHVQLKVLAQMPVDSLHLPGIRQLTQAIVDHLGPKELSDLSFDGVQTVSAPLIRALVQMQNKNTSGLAMAALELTPEVRAELKEHHRLEEKLRVRVHQ